MENTNRISFTEPPQCYEIVAEPYSIHNKEVGWRYEDSNRWDIMIVETDPEGEKLNCDSLVEDINKESKDKLMSLFFRLGNLVNKPFFT